MCNVARTHTNHTMKSNVSSSARVCAFPWKSGKICCWLLNAYEHTHNMELPATRYALHYCNCRSAICWKCELMYSHHHRRMRLLCASIENNEFDLNSVLFSSSSFFFDYFWLFRVVLFLYVSWLAAGFFLFLPLLFLSCFVPLFSARCLFSMPCVRVLVLHIVLLFFGGFIVIAYVKLKSTAHHPTAQNKPLIFESHLWIGS